MSDAEVIRDLTFRLAELERKVEHLLANVPDVRAVPPPSDEPSDRVRQLVAEGNLIGAIKLYREETRADLSTAKERVEALQRG